MADEIDIFYTPEGYPNDHRWDEHQNGKLLNIVFFGGTFGNFLKYFLDKFSKHTPDIKKNPFTDIGTSHVLFWEHFSGKIQRYHASFINDNEGAIDLPVCMIEPNTKKHFHYLKRAQWYRQGNHRFASKPQYNRVSTDHLWQKSIGEMRELYPEQIDSIKTLYGIKEDAYFTWIPKFIVRDWYKLEFLRNLDQSFEYRLIQTLKGHPFFERQKTFHLDVETFFQWESFIPNLKELDSFFSLELDFDRIDEMRSVFDQHFQADHIRQECNMIDDLLENKSHHDLADLEVASQAFIYAEIEKRYPDIQMPLTNRFFRDTEEIYQFIEHFPNWYRRPNPNLG